MSSNEEGESSGNTKRRKIERACDVCRKKKTRCEPIEGVDDRCATCAKFGYGKCTFEDAPPKRGRHQKELVERLQKRVKQLEALFRRLHPDIDLETLLVQDEPPMPSQTLIMLSTMPAVPRPGAQPLKKRDFLSDFIHAAVEIPPAPDDDDDVVDLNILDGFGRLSIHECKEGLFFGKSSGFMLLQTALDFKQKLSGPPKLNAPDSRILAHRRKDFWCIPSWELPAVQKTPSSSYQFPDGGLMSALIDKYFSHYHPFLPFLHRPTFERSIKEGLHLRDDTFGGIVLLVCANGARHSDDPRVLLDGTNSKLSCGWKWFTQVQVIRKSILRSPTLYDLQFYILVVMFLQSTSVGHGSWILVGIALRVAQEVGVHRKKRNTNTPSVEHELWKRAFWALMYMDRVMSSVLGRTSAIGDEDFDLDFPLEVDDEYWEHPDPNQAFKQPPDKPSLVSSFNCSLRLMHILEEGRRMLYCNNKSKAHLGLEGEWEKPIVVQLDSLLNHWITSLPEHLRWDPTRKNDLFFDQAAELHCQYYYVQMVLHRPFLRSSSSLSPPAIAICTNAARNCGNVIHIHAQRAPSSVIPMGKLSAFFSSIILLLHSWSAKRSGLATSQQKDLLVVRKCMDSLKKLEGRLAVAGRLWDMLDELAQISNLSWPQSAGVTDCEDNTANSLSVVLPEVSVSSSPFAADPNGIPSESPTFTHPYQPTPVDDLGAPRHFDLSSGRSMSEFSTSQQHTAPRINTNEVQPHVVSSAERDVYDQLLSGYGEPFQQSVPVDDTNPWPTLLPYADAQSPASVLHHVMFDSGAMDLWMGAPSSLELEDWGHYLSNVGDLTHGTVQPPSNGDLS